MQALAFVKEGEVSKQMVKFISDVPRESWVEVKGTVQVPGMAITGTSQQVFLPSACAPFRQCNALKALVLKP